MGIFRNRKAHTAAPEVSTSDIDTLRAQIERNAQDTANTLRVEYRNFAARLLEFVAAVESAENAAKAANKLLQQAGRTDLIRPVIDRAFADGPDVWPPPIRWAHAVVAGLAKPSSTPSPPSLKR